LSRSIFPKNNFSEFKASYGVSLILAKNGKFFRVGETSKECSMKVVLAFGGKKWESNLCLGLVLTKRLQGWWWM